MSLIFRMIYVLLRAMKMPALPIGPAKNKLTLRTLPNDLDINFHMNNGRYLTICDLTRVDVFIRSGLAKLMIKKKWAPIISEHTMQYRRPLNLWQKFDVSMEFTHWDEKYFYMTHRFTIGDKLVAEGTSKGVVFSRRDGVIPPDQVIAALRIQRGIPESTDSAEAAPDIS